MEPCPHTHGENSPPGKESISSVGERVTKAARLLSVQTLKTSFQIRRPFPCKHQKPRFSFDGHNLEICGRHGIASRFEFARGPALFLRIL
jgi:hypothetical protein